jgi:hypothetical protein
MKKRSNETTLGEAIDRLIKAYRLDDKMSELDILSSWEEMMGKAVALRTDDIYIKNHILHIKLNSSVMRDELKAGKRLIIERVNAKAGRPYIVDVWFG